MNKRLIDYQENLLHELQDPNEAIAYLNAALMDADPRVFLLALRSVIDAQNIDISATAKKAKLNRENLYKMLSKKGNPQFSSLVALINAMNWHLAIQPNQD